MLASSNLQRLLTPAWTPLRPHPVQCRLWRCKKRFAAVPAGRGSGKTELAKRKLVLALTVPKPWPDPKYFYGAPTRAQAKFIAWDHFQRLIPPAWIEPNGIKETELVIKTVFGSSLHILGLDKPQRAEGGQWDGGVLDESCDYKPKVFDKNFLPALTHRDGWCWRIGVPKRYGSSAAEFREFYEEGLCDNPNQDSFTWPSKDILSPAKLAYLAAHLDARDYAEQCDARFDTAGGGIYHAFTEEYNVRPCSYDPTRPLIVSSDFNVDPMAWVIGHDRGGIVEWIDELWLRDANTQSALNVLWSRYQHHTGGFLFYGDAASRARKTSASSSDYRQIYNDKRFRQAGRTIHYPNANPGVKDRWAAVNAMFCSANNRRNMFVDSKCKHLIRDLKAAALKPNSTEPETGGDLLHITDAMGYFVQYEYPVPVDVDGTDEVFISAGNAA